MHTDEPPLNIVEESIPQMPDEVKHALAAGLADAADRAVADEIMTAPKPGLVDPLGPGCHADMDLRTFLQSADAIRRFWHSQAMVGLSGISCESALPMLRSIGIEMETSMFAATCGINTHKGLIYLMSLLLYGAGFSLYNGMPLSPEAVAAFASSAVKGTVEKELLPLRLRPDINRMTHGEKLFVLHGVTGIRGEAEAGFPSVLNAGLPAFNAAVSAGAGRNEASLAALLAIMEVNEDSNVIHRGGFDFWTHEYRSAVREAREKFDPLSGCYKAILDLEKFFMLRRVSPGGAADLLSCTLFLDKITSPACQQ